MSTKKTLGGDRLGAGKKMEVELTGFGRSTHDLGYLWRSTMAAGTLVPFLKEVALPGDKFEIDLDCDIKTHPTIGPLFGSYKVQLDVFYAPIRLYQGRLHNNEQKIGMKMKDIKLPTFALTATPFSDDIPDINTAQINPSCLLAYLGIRGIGRTNEAAARVFNAIPWVMYWDIYKNYYANQQEEIGAVIHNDLVEVIATVDDVMIEYYDPAVEMGHWPATSQYLAVPGGANGTLYTLNYTGARPDLRGIMVAEGANDFMVWYAMSNVMEVVSETAGVINLRYTGNSQYVGPWRYMQADEMPQTPVKVQTFDLAELDNMRTQLLMPGNSSININTVMEEPFNYMLEANQRAILSSQEGLALKTYQSDLLNNWLSTEWIDGPTGINAITAIDTSGGSFNIDTMILSKKVYDMLNRIAVSGGTYDDWQEANYMVKRNTETKSPVYMGGLIKELVFQEVVSNAEAGAAGETAQPLGTLAGKGIMGKKHKGGRVEIRVDELGYVMGIISLTPRIDYAQGNKWDTHLLTVDDLHKPSLDEIGFQELMTEQMAWWATYWNTTADEWQGQSAGKQPAWVNYMTNVNQVYGNFAIENEEMFMVLARRYESEDWYQPDGGIKDLTTYIDPAKFNHIFAQTDLTSQNFWAQIGVDMKVRRVMSNKVMPNL